MSSSHPHRSEQHQDQRFQHWDQGHLPDFPTRVATTSTFDQPKAAYDMSFDQRRLRLPSIAAEPLGFVPPTGHPIDAGLTLPPLNSVFPFLGHSMSGPGATGDCISNRNGSTPIPNQRVGLIYQHGETPTMGNAVASSSTLADPYRRYDYQGTSHLPPSRSGMVSSNTYPPRATYDTPPPAFPPAVADSTHPGGFTLPGGRTIEGHGLRPLRAPRMPGLDDVPNAPFWNDKQPASIPSLASSQLYSHEETSTNYHAMASGSMNQPPLDGGASQVHNYDHRDPSHLPVFQSRNAHYFHSYPPGATYDTPSHPRTVDMWDTRQRTALSPITAGSTDIRPVGSAVEGLDSFLLPGTAPSSLGRRKRDPKDTAESNRKGKQPASVQGPSQVHSGSTNPAACGGVTQVYHYETNNYVASVENASLGPNYGTLTQSSSDNLDLVSLAQQLKISAKAKHGYYPGGDEQDLRRSGCTPGTRVRIINDILCWITNTSQNSESVFWLSGQAGAGKTTIAYTISHQLESLVNSGSGKTVLGGTFFCSRHSKETSTASAIVRTIVHQLALKSEAFKTALKQYGKFETVDDGPRSQLEGLLVEPWKRSAKGRQTEGALCFTFPIDALDELDGAGGMEFLGALFDIVGKHRLPGLKFFVTSRAEPSLAARIRSFDDKRICRLEDVPIEESSADIKLYLQANLDTCANQAQILQLVDDAAGLFIYAATVVEYIKGRNVAEQHHILQKLLALSRSPKHRSPVGVTARLDGLYQHILETSLVDPRDRGDDDIFIECLSILHTFLCTIERTPPSVAIELLNQSNADGQHTTSTGVAEGVLHRLHSVLYSKFGQVMWFHKSFPDFIFDPRRSERFHCDQDSHNQLLLTSCFSIMRKELRFNIANISTSYKLDRDNTTLSSCIESNISSVLSYACRCWNGHLAHTPVTSSDQVCGVVSEFVQLRILFWIEAMNLLKQRGRCEGMLREARKWMAGLEDSLELTCELDDAAVFALYFSSHGASLSTPHLYISSLATFPRDSDLTRRWRRNFRGIPTFTNARSTAGGALLSSFMVGSEVNTIAVSMDGRQIAVGSGNGFIGVWDVATGEELKVLKGHAKAVTSVAYSPDGAHIVSGSEDKSVRIWDMSTREQLKVLKGHKQAVLSVAYSPDGKCIACGSGHISVHILDISTGKERMILKGHKGRVMSVAYSPNGTQIVSGSRDRSVRVWNASTGELLQLLEGHSKGVNSVAYSPDSTRIVSGSWDKSVRVWDPSTGQLLKLLKGHSGKVISVAYSLGGTQIVSGSEDKSVRVWDASTGKQVQLFEGHNGDVELVAFSPNGTHVVSGSKDRSVRVWDMSNREQAKPLEGHSEVVNSFACSLDGTQIVSGSYDKSVRVWDASSGKQLQLLEGHSKSVTSVAYSPDGTQIVSGSWDNSVRVWDASSGKQVQLLEGHSNSVWSVAYSPDGTQIVSGSSDKSVRVWDASSGKQLQLLEGHSNSVLSVAYSPDGTQIVSGSCDNSVRVWDASSGKQLQLLEGHSESVTSVAYSPDGTQIVSGSWDNSVRVWDASSGKQLQLLEGHSSKVRSVAYSPNGAQVVSASDDMSSMWSLSKARSPSYIREKTLQGELTGWLLSPTDPLACLMFIPLSEYILDDCVTLTFPRLHSYVDFSTAILGEKWTQCYIPFDTS